MQGIDFIVQYLIKHAKVSHVFTYTGGTNAWLLEALSKTKGITFIPTRHEQNAAFAADGYARVNGKLGVAVTMSGPGATNLVTGIADAYFDSVPVLFLTGQVTTSTYKFNRPIRQLGYQETDIVSIVKPITKYADMCIDESGLSMMFKKSISLALTERFGPVLFDVPTDIQRKDVAADELAVGPIIEAYPKADEAEIIKVLELVERSSRPVLLVGGGIRSSGTCSLLKQFAEKLNIPVVVSLMGKDSFPNDHQLYVGFIGSYGNRFANLVLANSDLIITLGSRLDSRQTANPKTFARAAKKVHIDIDKNELNNTIKCDITIHSHLKYFFDGALRIAKSDSRNKYKDWFKYIEKVRREFRVEGGGPNKGVNPKAFLRKLSELADKNEIFITDVGNNQIWSAQELLVRSNQRFLTSGGLGSMGFAIPAGIGAHYASLNSPITAIVGDGGFQMSLPELQTITHNKIPIKIIVFNNNILGLMWHFQNENFPAGSHPATEQGYSCPDIKKVAAAFGIPFKRIKDNGSVGSSLKWLFANRGPLILEIDVHPNWAGYPKIKPGNPLECQLPEIAKEKLKHFMLIPMLS